MVLPPAVWSPPPVFRSVLVILLNHLAGPLASGWTTSGPQTGNTVGTALGPQPRKKTDINNIIIYVRGVIYNFAAQQSIDYSTTIDVEKSFLPCGWSKELCSSDEKDTTFKYPQEYHLLLCKNALQNKGAVVPKTIFKTDF